MNYFRIRQRFDTRQLADIAGTLAVGLKTQAIEPGARVALAVGSRGIANLPAIVLGVADWVRAQGAEPFIVPAMGSHAGATAEGQRKLLESFGITGAPIVSSMEVVELAPGVFMDKAAAEADGVIVINRVKPHTSFHGRYESGLMKMIAVGLGKQTGAAAIHRLGIPGLRDEMPEVARQVLATGKILFGVALVENAYDETLAIKVTRRIPEDEPALLELARANMPSLPVEELDLLIVDEIGKEISGTGMDTNVIGRLRIAGEAEPVRPRIEKIFVRDVRGDSAYGIGLADVTTRRLVARTDWSVTRTNVETSGFTLRGVIPPVVDADDEAVCGRRIARIKNTLHLETLIVSEAVRQEIEGRDTIEVLGPANLWDEL
ncbi:MAG: hypothetical protein PCFJNLEI_03851 [Verrucomicrobiae bacterium]|nr:hypothetical protein [Verrucomicrobiae bacterium]